MPKLSIANLIHRLEAQRVRLYQLYIDILDVGTADRLLYESNQLLILIEALKRLS